MLNCSPSSKAHLCSDDDVVDREAVEPQKLFFSVGDGGTKTPESLISLNLYSTGSFASALNCLLLALLAGFSPVSGVGEGRTFSSCLRKGFLMIAMAVEGKRRYRCWCTIWSRAEVGQARWEVGWEAGREW